MDVVRVVVAVTVAFAMAWIVFIAFLLIIRPPEFSLREVKRFVPDVAWLLTDLARDPSVSRRIRRHLGFLLVYLASPIDLIPDFIPVLGYADDVILIVFVLRSVIRQAGADPLERHWRGTPEGLDILRRAAGLGPTTNA